MRQCESAIVLGSEEKSLFSFDVVKLVNSGKVSNFLAYLAKLCDNKQNETIIAFWVTIVPLKLT